MSYGEKDCFDFQEIDWYNPSFEEWDDSGWPRASNSLRKENSSPTLVWGIFHPLLVQDERGNSHTYLKESSFSQILTRFFNSAETETRRFLVLGEVWELTHRIISLSLHLPRWRKADAKLRNPIISSSLLLEVTLQEHSFEANCMIVWIFSGRQRNRESKWKWTPR